MASGDRHRLMPAVDENGQTPDTDMFFLPLMNTGEADSFFICCTADKTFY